MNVYCILTLFSLIVLNAVYCQKYDKDYNFAYAVNDPPSGNNYYHKAESVGGTVTGEYSVLLPDGRTQVVRYIADEKGYRADVTYKTPFLKQTRRNSYFKTQETLNLNNQSNFKQKIYKFSQGNEAISLEEIDDAMDILKFSSQADDILNHYIPTSPLFSY